MRKETTENTATHSTVSKNTHVNFCSNEKKSLSDGVGYTQVITDLRMWTIMALLEKTRQMYLR